MSTAYFENIKFYEDVNYIGVDGYELSYLTGDSYMFSTSGNHIAEFSFAGGNIPDSMFAYCDDIITAYINEDSCEIGAYAFMQCQSLESVYIPSTMAYINSYAFYDTQISYLEILATTPPTLGDNVFSTEPDYISVPVAYENDYKQASGWSEYEDVINPQPVFDIDCVFDITTTSSGTWLYSSGSVSSIDELYIDGVKQDTVVYQYQFDTTGTHKVQINLKNNTAVPTEMFASVTNLTDCKLTDTITSLGQYGTFRGASNLTYVNIPSQVTTIGNQLFNNTKISYITLPQGLTSIGMNGFGSCRYLTSIELPSSMTSIGDGAFSGCTSLERVVSYALTPPTLAWSNCFNNNASGRKIYVPAASVNLYKEAQYWSNYASDIEPIYEPTPQVEYSVEYNVYAPDVSQYYYINPIVFYIYDENDNEEFSIELFEELVDRIEVNGNELLVESESDLEYSTIQADEENNVKIVFNNSVVPTLAFQDIIMNECVVGEGITSLESCAFYFAGQSPIVNHKTSLHLPSTLATIEPDAINGCFLDIYLDATTPPGPTDPNDPACNIDCSQITTILHVPSASQTLYENSAWGNTFGDNINPLIDIEYQLYAEYSPEWPPTKTSILSVAPFSQGGSYSDQNFYNIISQLLIDGNVYTPDYDNDYGELMFVPEATGIHFITIRLQANASLPTENLFDGWDNIPELRINTPITSLGPSTLSGIYGGEVYLPSTLTALTSTDEYTHWNSDCDTVFHIDAATPPTITSDSAGELLYTPIYVPETSETQYKTATNWSTLANNINPKKQVKVLFNLADYGIDSDNYEYHLHMCNGTKTPLTSYMTSVISKFDRKLEWLYPWQYSLTPASQLSGNAQLSQLQYIMVDDEGTVYPADPGNVKYLSLTSDTTIASEMFKGAFRSYELEKGGEPPTPTQTIPNIGFAEVEIKEGITTIESGAFQNSYISAVKLPSTITTIGDYAFNTSNVYNNFYFYIKADTPPTIGNNVFDGMPNLTIYVPTAYVNNYKAATGWSNYAQYIEGIYPFDY